MDRRTCPWPAWQLREMLGEGSFGSVWRGWNESEGRESAIKVIRIPPEEDWIPALREEGLNDGQILAEIDQLAEAWRGEAEKLTRIRGAAHVVRLEEYAVLGDEGSAEREIWLRMEKLKSLTAYLADKSLSEQEVIQIGLDLCDALITCHSHGIIHGDIKPDNVLVDDGGPGGAVFKLGDFGMSRDLRKQSHLLPSHGAPAYMAPEVAEGGEPDSRADQYALGLTLYRLMNENRLPFLSRRPFASREEQNMAQRMRLSGMPLPPPCQASAAFAEIILRACSVSPAERYPSARHMRAALSALQSRQRRAAGGGAPRVRAGIVLGATVLAAVLGITGWLLIWHGFEAAPASRLEGGMIQAEKITARGRVREQLTRLAQAMPAGGQYQIPVHLTNLMPLAELRGVEVEPRWQGEGFVMADGSEDWAAMMTLADGSVISYVFQPREGCYLPAGGNSKSAPETLCLIAGESARGEHTMEYRFRADTLAPEGFTINLYDSSGQVRTVITRMLEQDEPAWILYQNPENMSPLRAEYTADGRLRSITTRRQTWSAKETLPVLEHVAYLP